ncbi:hypothetical protein HNR06_003006 [Nocardiopsis arvandica]|uniref:Uncharacterized protein n=1 Tax=Nocardiopsis sinuspersici TaxID=501010 RepID=A0A7Z0BLC2_9ACTN|nr:hypothetical protein [Nocardiopsis sinuspersici]
MFWPWGGAPCGKGGVLGPPEGWGPVPGRKPPDGACGAPGKPGAPGGGDCGACGPLGACGGIWGPLWPAGKPGPPGGCCGGWGPLWPPGKPCRGPAGKPGPPGGYCGGCGPPGGVCGPLGGAWEGKGCGGRGGWPGTGASCDCCGPDVGCCPSGWEGADPSRSWPSPASGPTGCPSGPYCGWFGWVLMGVSEGSGGGTGPRRTEVRGLVRAVASVLVSRGVGDRDGYLQDSRRRPSLRAQTSLLVASVTNAGTEAGRSTLGNGHNKRRRGHGCDPVL